MRRGTGCTWLTGVIITLLAGCAPTVQAPPPVAAAPAPPPPQGPPPPNSQELAEILDLIRANAINYSNNLPNFLCTQVTHRNVDTTGTGDHWRQMDTIQEQLSFFEHREKYTVTVPDKDPNAKTLTLYVDVTNPHALEYTFRDIPIT